jgi:two-component system cell cycle sensor histidine kinase PleC
MVRAVSMGQREGLGLTRGWASLKSYAVGIAAGRRLEPLSLLNDRTVHAVLALANLTLAVAFVTAMSDVIGPVTGAGVSLSATAIALMLMLRTSTPAAPASRTATAKPAVPAYAGAAPADGARREVSGLLAMMSHELRTPLNAILGNADAIRLEALGPIGAVRYRESAAHIREGGQALLRATEDMIALTGAVASAAFAPHHPVDIEETTLDVLRAAAGDARQKGVELSWQPGTGRAVLSEATALRHAVTRIVDAALANAETGAGIHVELLPCGNAVELLVTLTHADETGPKSQMVDAGADRGPAALQVAVARTLLVLLGTHLHTAYGIDGRWRAILELPVAPAQ